ncbi:MAG: hypothetical protein JXQ23_13510 [Clostridia bacterium]|nr:hypothetical protein [Clostridia bacterium]
MKSYQYADAVFTIEGALSVEDNDLFTQPWRIDYKRKELFPYLNDEFQGGACPGVRICFTSDCTELAIEILEMHERDTGFHDVMMIDLVVNKKYIETVLINAGVKCYEFKKMEAGPKNIELWLDQAFPVKFKKILINDEAFMKKTEVKSKRWVIYGSSITHSVRAKSPSSIWPGLVALEKNLHLTNLGFGGQCILDPIIGNEMSDLEADLFTLKLGANIFTGRLHERSFEPCAIGLIEAIRKNHKTTPVVLVSPIIFPEYEELKGASLLCIMDIRHILQKLAEKYKRLGDENIHYFDGRVLMDTDSLRYMPDKVHPDGEGQYIMARHFIDNILNKIT